MALLKAILCGLGLALAVGTALGQGLRDPKVRGYTQGEWALLPDWCIDSQDGPYGSPEGGGYTNKSPRAGKWVSLMGTDFWHMHHYCRALRDMRRAQAANISKRDRDFVLARAISDFEYVLNNCQPSMVLMPEVYLRMGETFLLQNKAGDAATAFEQARKLKPDYWPAYDRWIGVLMDLKQFDSARRLANEGLSHAPGQPQLLARLKTINDRSGQRATPAAP
jgi:tetratricopeptide (TPR) repeat protein